ncbi:triose-phosphate isomerase [Collinsella sp. AGMB00827]|uniref:Triose-phosphate isomerase n=1 Tax=Collinsella ureilytica TaxID=2869515 RepID=A0ABS7MK57_9ACTN|nr:triose-phosphate isomerase [Collinsella urealyticum]MBY4797757.1 triose-phosphate isomerase [Collinsella urealyticum]
MEKAKLRAPFFVVNPKSYLYGEELLRLARKADELAAAYDFDVLFTAQLIDLPRVIDACPHLIPCAQFMESLKPGRGMGHVLPEALAEAGVRATFLNHAENPSGVHELAAVIERANEVGILTVVCADSVEEGRWIAGLKPDVMVCELTGLIGTGTTADEAYMRSSTKAVKAISPTTQVLQAAGISSGEDVYNAIKFGADGTGGTSGIVAAPDPFAALDEMFAALDRARTDFCQEA